MSGRIRSIKPELLDDELAAQLSDEAWRLWVSMWVLADDHGNLRGGDKYLAANVWQDTSRDVARPLQELIDGGFLHPYAKEGQRYVHINGWEKHQRIDNAGKPRVPTLDQDDGTWDAQTSGMFAYSRGGSRRAAAKSGAQLKLAPDDPSTGIQQVAPESAETVGESPRPSATVVTLPLARARAQSGGETTISTNDHDHEGKVPASDQDRPAGGPLPDGVVSFERTMWVETYKLAVMKLTGNPYTFPGQKFGALRSVVEDRCLGEDRKNIPAWIEREVNAFVRDRQQTGWPPNTQDPWHPDALLAWENNPDRQAVRRAASQPKIRTPASPAPKPTMTAEETAAAAAGLQKILGGFGGMS